MLLGGATAWRRSGRHVLAASSAPSKTWRLRPDGVTPFERQRVV
jgi:hypothetical protein